MTAPLWLGSYSQSRDDSSDSASRHPPLSKVIEQARAASVDPDAELVTALRDSNSEIAKTAFETIFRSYYPLLGDFATRYLYARDIANEVVSDTLVRIWDRRNVLEIHGTLRAFLYTAVANSARNRRRDMEREYKRAERSLVGGEDPAWMGMRTPASDTLATAADIRNRLWDIVQALGEDGTILLLRWRHGFDYEEIGQALGVSAMAAQRRHSRAMKRLRAAVPDLFREEIE